MTKFVESAITNNLKIVSSLLLVVKLFIIADSTNFVIPVFSKKIFPREVRKEVRQAS